MRNGDRLTSVEIQAVTVEDAIRLALDQLALTRDDVDIEIVKKATLTNANQAPLSAQKRGKLKEISVVSSPVSAAAIVCRNEVRLAKRHAKERILALRPPKGVLQLVGDLRRQIRAKGGTLLSMGKS